MKTVRNQINRQVNCETANLQKVVDAAVRQVKAIRIIDREIGIEELPEKIASRCKTSVGKSRSEFKRARRVNGW